MAADENGGSQLLSPRTPGELEELVGTLRRLGVTRITTSNGVTLDISPHAPVVAPVETPVAKQESLEPPKRGRDGLTKEEQIDLYGKPMDLLD